jgi:hypothetical protein
MYKHSSDSLSIHELIWRVADNEVEEYVQSRWFANDRKMSSLLKPSRIPADLSYFCQNVSQAIRIIKALRLGSYQFISTLPDHCWDVRLEIPAHGSIALSEWMQAREAYTDDCIQEMDRLHVVWRVAQFDNHPGLTSRNGLQVDDADCPLQRIYK